MSQIDGDNNCDTIRTEAKSLAPSPCSPDYVLVPRAALKALLHELRAIREEQSEQQKRLARATGELVEWVNFPANSAFNEPGSENPTK